VKQKLKTSIALFVGALSFASITASGAVVLGINDLSDTPTIVGTSPYGFDPTSLSVQVNTEAVDIHGEYLSLLNLANGQTVTINFNFLGRLPDDPPGTFSDTLNLVFTGHTPTGGDANNLIVDMHFRSDIDPATEPSLTNPISVTEDGTFQALGTQIAQNGGPTDFLVSVASDPGTPEPASFLIMGAGLILAGSISRRQAKRIRRPS
jgi:hypothetical protein